jgi:hypothetical protein
MQWRLNADNSKYAAGTVRISKISYAVKPVKYYENQYYLKHEFTKEYSVNNKGLRNKTTKIS